MKTSRIIISSIIAAGAPGMALLAMAGLIPTDIALAILTVAGILAFAAFDYSWAPKRLEHRAQLLRPTLPLRSSSAPVVACVRRAA